ncbi:serine hydrolase domain-containing protein [Actinomadura decatromicini]|uniref:Beta-lactamase family protein n=1 Tax=Actinomadura decatromicini TaxID=2604572 RepID=A0A5D3FTY9_9ACTN|nr:serine hydrolase domain-containing protein [Actinomadura decatromicini]TYK51336.1 beta-lactamase family protein [Actinomadura decatromicini]
MVYPIKSKIPVLLAALTVFGGAVAAGAPALANTKKGGEPGNPAVQAKMDALVRDGFPGVLAAVRGRDGRAADYVAGVGDRATGAKPPVNGHVRIASNTKTFTATVVLQLVGEGKVGLDAPIEKYLPGLVRGKGIDPNKITVRNVLQHTSGIPNYSRYLDLNGFNTRDIYREPRELIDMALQHPADFPPGAKWEYSNTNYVIAGLLVQKVTGRPIGEEITNRIVRPLGLRDTYWPQVGERGIRGAHPKGYDAAEPGGTLRDITRLDPSAAWAAGQLVSTPRDLNRFFGALLGGRLLRPAELAEMKRTVPSPGETPGASYGLGLMKRRLSCGGDLWGHGGDINGYETRNGVTTDGRAATVAVTALPSAIRTTEDEMMKVHQHVVDTLDTALCS